MFLKNKFCSKVYMKVRICQRGFSAFFQEVCCSMWTSGKQNLENIETRTERVVDIMTAFT